MLSGDIVEKPKESNEAQVTLFSRMQKIQEALEKGNTEEYNELMEAFEKEHEQDMEGFDLEKVDKEEEAVLQDKSHGPPIVPKNIPKDDAATYSLSLSQKLSSKYGFPVQAMIQRKKE